MVKYIYEEQLLYMKCYIWNYINIKKKEKEREEKIVREGK